MSFLKRLFGKRATAAMPPQEAAPSEQAVLVYLDGKNLPVEVYRDCDLATIEDRLREAIEKDGLGEFDGNEIGETETTLYMYGPDAERLFAGIELTLRAYPLCKNARVVIRRGGPGGEQREIRL